jgi:hypothetical protein
MHWKNLLFCLFMICSFLGLKAQVYEIEVSIDNYGGDTLLSGGSTSK